MKKIIKIILYNISVYLITLVIDSVLTVLITDLLGNNHLSIKEIFSGSVSFFVWGIILFIWFALPAIIIFNFIVFIKRSWFTNKYKFIFLGLVLGCISFAIGGGISEEDKVSLIIGIIQYTIIGGIYSWLFFQIIIKSIGRNS